MLEVEINETRNTKKSKIENVEKIDLFVDVSIIEVKKKKLKCEKLSFLFLFTIGNSDRNRLSREIEDSNDVELELENRNLKLTKLFLYEVIVESKRFMTCFNLTDEVCYSIEYDDKKNETNLIFF